MPWQQNESAGRLSWPSSRSMGLRFHLLQKWKTHQLRSTPCNYGGTLSRPQWMRGRSFGSSSRRPKQKGGNAWQKQKQSVHIARSWRRCSRDEGSICPTIWHRSIPTLAEFVLMQPGPQVEYLGKHLCNALLAESSVHGSLLLASARNTCQLTEICTAMFVRITEGRNIFPNIQDPITCLLVTSNETPMYPNEGNTAIAISACVAHCKFILLARTGCGSEQKTGAVGDGVHICGICAPLLSKTPVWACR